MRISDWSSDVCSSDLNALNHRLHDGDQLIGQLRHRELIDGLATGAGGDRLRLVEIVAEVPAHTAGLAGLHKENLFALGEGCREMEAPVRNDAADEGHGMAAATGVKPKSGTAACRER